MTVQIISGDCRNVLPTLASERFDCIVTSPPYWGAQRDYGSSIGLELEPAKYIENLVSVFAGCRRVLKSSGCLWVVIGDSYAAGGKGGGGSMMLSRGPQWGHRANLKGWRSPPTGYKQKDLVGIPWLMANALRASGWTLRRDIIWNKMAATEPSRQDRPSGSHEYVFLLSKGIHYWFDCSALPHGTVWNIRPSGWAGHPAAFPPGLIEPCIKAGCPECGIVLDPFAGAGTTGMVADRLNRDALLIELNDNYSMIARDRIVSDAPLFTELVG